MKTLTRREFLNTTLAGAGLTIAVSFSPLGVKLLSAASAKEASESFRPNVWLRITTDNAVTIVVNKSEMGQGVHTALPMIVADELGADWKRVKVQIAPADARYNDPLSGAMLTGGSTSVRHMYEPLRKAGAAAREMLVKAAAKTWGVSEDVCEASQGMVRQIGSMRKATFGALALKAAKLPVPKDPVLKKESAFAFMGRPLDRVDVPGKVSGKAQFGIDSFVPGMLYAALARPPAFGAKPLTYDSAKARKVKGVSRVVPIERGIAVCAATPEAAWKGKAALNATWDQGTAPDLSNDTLAKVFLAGLEKEGPLGRKEGDAQKALKQAAKKNTATYLLPYLCHVTMEPMNCTADVRKDGCDVWVPTQFQTRVLALASDVTGLRPDQINVHTTYLGGGFGRRAEVDVVEEALQVSKAVGKPVKVIWTREEDIKYDFYRPATSTRIEGGLDEKGGLIAWYHKIVCPSIFARVFPSRVQGGIDPAAMDCLADLEYEVPNFTVEYVRMDTPVPVGFWRSVGASHNAFTIESFVDEMAVLAGRDPVEFRLALLKNHRRAYRVVETAAEKAGWGKPVRKGMGRGIAWAIAFGSYVAQTAEVSVEKDGTIKVHRVVCAVDCGPFVNPAIIMAQIKGAIIMGLGPALQEQVRFAEGGVASANFVDYQPLRMSRAPAEIEVHIVKSSDAQGGIGEPGLPPIAPAVANALFNATGVRLRNLPLLPETVKKALEKA